MTSICSDLWVPKPNHLHITKYFSVPPTIFHLQNKPPARREDRDTNESPLALTLPAPPHPATGGFLACASSVLELRESDVWKHFFFSYVKVPGPEV